MMGFNTSGLLNRSGGEIAGKVRLQKTVYLLDQMGLHSGFSFEYHHYGPYSAELADQVEDDIIFSRIKAETYHRKSDSTPYLVFKSLGVDNKVTDDCNIDDGTFSFALEEFKKVSATALELAATIHWLAFVEKVGDWHSELVRRKGSKTEGGRDRKALALLQRLNLAPTGSA